MPEYWIIVRLFLSRVVYVLYGDWSYESEKWISEESTGHVLTH
jgi:hypothetical protein